MEQENWLEKAEQIIRGNDYAHLNLNFDELQQALSHVYWVGGSGCAGKSSIAKKLAEQYHLSIYHCDDHLRAQRARVESEQLPLPIMAGRLANRKAGIKNPGDDQENIDPSEYMGRGFALWQEVFTLVLDDLRSMPATPIIAEGVYIVPWLVMKMTPRSRVATLVSYDAFRRKTYMNPDRPDVVLNRFKHCSDPERALEKVLQANHLIAQTLFRCAQMHNLFVIEVDGSVDVDSITRTVADHFCL